MCSVTAEVARALRLGPGVWMSGRAVALLATDAFDPHRADEHTRARYFGFDQLWSHEMVACVALERFAHLFSPPLPRANALPRHVGQFGTNDGLAAAVLLRGDDADDNATRRAV